MSMETRVRIDKQGSVLIPAPFRRALDIKQGDQVILQMEEDGLLITTMKKRIERAQRRVRKYVKPGISLADELIADRRAEFKREQEDSE